jgi:L-threonylcarbamoyladenylate synthase
MAVRVLRVDLHRIGAAATAAASVLRRGGIVALPTETFYGLAVDPENQAAVRSLYRIKQRTGDKPLPILVRDRDQVGGLARPPLPATLEALADAFWPGPLTVILAVREGFAPEALAGGSRIAVRVTSHPVARAVIEQVGGPITGTSANRSGRPPCRGAEAVRRDLGDGVDLILDGGESLAGHPSTLLDLTRRPHPILRPGAVGRRDLAAVLGPDLA